MKSRNPRIDAYIDRSAPFARPILTHLRTLVHSAHPAVGEDLKWGSPAFLHGTKILCFMAAFKAHCTFGFWNRAMSTELGAHSKSGEAMGHLGRLASLADLPPDKTLLRSIRRAVELCDQEAPSRSPRRRKHVSEKAMPADLAATLAGNRTAAATFAKFSPSHRKEYIEWIVEAKRPETRQKRLATTVAWLAEGKSRNWKYETR